MKSKYFYKGVPLLQYCKEKNLEYSTIHTRIQRLKLKHSIYSDEEIVKLAIDKESKIKYFYNNENLRTFCSKNNLKYSTIRYRILNIKKSENYKNVPIEEIVKLAIEQQLSNTKYFYKGKSLMDYCKEYNLDYYKYAYRIFKLRKKKEYENLNNEELVKIAIDGSFLTNKYTYKGKQLKEYCKENEINYSTIMSRIFKLKKKEEYKDLDNDTLLKIAIESEIILGKYCYKGMPLRKYCDENDINYATIMSRIFNLKKQEEYKNLNHDTLLKIAIESEIVLGKYCYKGISLRKYCNDNNINYATIMTKVFKLKKQEECKDLTDEEIINKAMSEPINHRKR